MKGFLNNSHHSSCVVTNRIIHYDGDTNDFLPGKGHSLVLVL